MKRSKLLFICLFLSLASACFAQTFTPEAGKTLLVIGQDKDSIEDYIDSVGIVPGGFMGYTSVQDAGGLFEPKDHGAGENHAQYFVEKYPEAVIQIGLYMVDALDGVVNGAYDDNLKKIARWIKQTQRPVYLRVGYEFDFPGNHYEPGAYIQAYRYVVDFLKKEDVKNVFFV